jgi:hypothetical protein
MLRKGRIMNRNISPMILQSGSSRWDQIPASKVGLGPLGSNGGLTQTMAVLPGSPAIREGTQTGIATDQRGLALDSPPDIAAYQSQGFAPTLATPTPTAVFGQTVTVTATVSTPGGGVTTGNIEFLANGTSLGTSSLVGSGTATLSLTSLPVGTSSITAEYVGDSSLVSTPVSVLIAQAGTQLVLTPSLGPTATHAGAVVDLDVQVEPLAPGTGVPTGTVTFEFLHLRRVKTVTLSAGSASLLAPFKSVRGSLTILYSGDDNFDPSAPLTTTITRGSFTASARSLARLTRNSHFAARLGRGLFALHGGRS